MKPIVKYIEHKPAEHTDRATAWIARVWPSSSGRTLYFNDMALKRSSGYDSNHCDLVSGEDYWVSGVKKNGSNRHSNGGGPIYIEKSLVEWYEAYVHEKDFNGLIEIPDLAKPDISKFNGIENERIVESSDTSDASTEADDVRG
ncbi:MAG TPA: hypothetical protein VJH03_10010 [Blastocatellia bacterium]|nr:hypothetical protein [Blastocatellia bacterium]